MSQVGQSFGISRVEGIIIVPLCTTQTWLPRLLNMLIADPLILPLNVIFFTRRAPILLTRTTIGLSCLGEPFRRREVSPKAIKLLMASWRNSTQTQCALYIKRWLAYFVRRKFDPHCQTEVVLDFGLLNYLKKGLKYGTIDSSGAALSNFVDNVKC